MVALRVPSSFRCTAFAALLLTAHLSAAFADDTPAPGEAWKSSPFHGAIDGSGKTIPCLCRFKGENFRLGAAVCMSTHVGTVIAKCDLLYNNTTWVPTSEPCTVSRAPLPQSFPVAG